MSAVWIAICVSLLVCSVQSIPALEDELLVNEDTKECAFKQTRECSKCFIRQGWKSIGLSSLGAECPSGYTQNESGSESSTCIPSRNEFCCSSLISVDGGDCDYLAFNEQEQQCTITLCDTLPNGWSCTAPDESFDGLCPYKTWIDSENLGCMDPCQDITTCSDCIDADCTWSIADETCHPTCEDESTCLATPISTDSSSTDFCNELSTVVTDNMECESKTSCTECQDTSLSDSSDNCRWVDSCSGNQGSNCQQCFASSCSSVCNEISDCSAVVPPPTETTTTTTTATEKVPTQNFCKQSNNVGKKCVTQSGKKGCCAFEKCQIFWRPLICKHARRKRRKNKKHFLKKYRKKKKLFRHEDAY